MKTYYETPSVVNHYATARFTGTRSSRTHRKESKIIDSFFKITGPVNSIIDVPCGAGRFQEQLWKHTSNLTEMDFSTTMLNKAQEELTKKFPSEIINHTDFATGSILDIPAPNKQFDLAFAMRIYHHFPNREERIKILQELERVSQRWAIISFYNARSFQHLRRLFRIHVRGRNSQRYSITLQQFMSEAEEAGWEVCQWQSNLRFISEQTIALLRVKGS